MSVLSLWFGLKAPVSRKAYLASGAGLMALKMAIDNGIAFAATGRPWPFAAYLMPSMVMKTQAMREALPTTPTPDGALAVMALVALPFLWVGVTMTIRRAADAGYSPWLGILFLVPGINYLTMLFFAAVPKAKRDATWVPVQLGPFRQHKDAPPLSEAGPVPPGLKSALIGLIAPIALALFMFGLSVEAAAVYGGALFFATPFVMGMTTAIIYNRAHIRPLGSTIGLANLSIALSGLVILLFAFEGILCLLMALPLAAVVATLGALVGYALASQGSKKNLMRNAAFMVATLPALTGVEAATAVPTLREVTTSVEIDAPPEKVWANVVGFSDLPPPPEWFFRLGIAYPMRATIVGSGVGAVRHCEFSTGPFVEPITTWDEPHRLAFDVTSQPPSMTELSPYGQIDAPHLEGYMVSKGGEFRLVPLPNDRTRLEGSTFYTLSIYPEAYWVVWSELLLHSIHGRVLDHIKNLTEHPEAARAHIAAK
jgi:uncharacterized membrane protein YhaH (DUF805 family)